VINFCCCKVRSSSCCSNILSLRNNLRSYSSWGIILNRFDRNLKRWRLWNLKSGRFWRCWRYWWWCSCTWRNSREWLSLPLELLHEWLSAVFSRVWWLFCISKCSLCSGSCSSCWSSRCFLGSRCWFSFLCFCVSFISLKSLIVLGLFLELLLKVWTDLLMLLFGLLKFKLSNLFGLLSIFFSLSFIGILVPLFILHLFKFHLLFLLDLSNLCTLLLGFSLDCQRLLPNKVNLVLDWVSRSCLCFILCGCRFSSFSCFGSCSCCRLCSCCSGWFC